MVSEKLYRNTFKWYKDLELFCSGDFVSMLLKLQFTLLSFLQMTNFLKLPHEKKGTSEPFEVLNW